MSVGTPSTGAVETPTVVAPDGTPLATRRVRRDAHRRFVVAAAIGGALSLLVYTWLLTAGTFDLFRWQPVGSFYDAQARSIAEGQLDVPADVVGIEGFEIDGETYIYQGPTPSLLRLPVAPFTEALDGQLTQLSMIVAFVVALTFATRIHWKVRMRTRGVQPLRGGESLAVGLITFALGAGSILVFTASRAFVFHEAALWGVACSLVAYDALLGYLARPRLRLLAVVSAFTTLAFLARASVAIGPLVAIGLVLLGVLLGRVGGAPEEASPTPTRGQRLRDRTRWMRPEARAPGRAIAGLTVAALVPVVVYCSLNLAKFGTLVEVPWDDQVFSANDPGRQAFLDEHGGFFSVDFVPTTAAQYLGPTGIGFDRLYPWIAFPELPEPVGDVGFDTIDWSAGLPAASPFFVVLGLLGGVVLLAPGRLRGPDSLAGLRVPVLGALAGSLAIFPFGFIAQRYLVDLFPLLLLTSLVGVHWLWRRVDAGATRRWIVPVAVGTALLVTFTAWANLSLGLWYQRVLNPGIDEERVAAFVDTQLTVDGWLPTGSLSGVTAGDELPAAGDNGDWFVLGDCAGLYRSDGKPLSELEPTNWLPVERTNDAGRFVLDIRFPDRVEGAREPLLVSGNETIPNTLVVEYLGDGEVAFDYEGLGLPLASEPVEVGDGEHTVEIVADRQVEFLEVRVDGEEVLKTFYRPDADTDDIVLFENAVDAPGVSSRFTGDSASRDLDAPVCEELRSRT